MCTLSSLVPPPLAFPILTLKVDSGASSNYTRSNDRHFLENRSENDGPHVTLPDNSIIKSNEKGFLPIAGLSSKTCQTHIFQDLKSASLLSVGTLCDDGCIVTFDKHKMYAHKHNQKILEGNRNKSDGLWDVQLPQQQHTSSSSIHNEKMNVIIKKDKTNSDLMQYLQGCCFSPRKSTLLRAVTNGNFITWPGMTPPNVSKHFQPTLFAAKGHLNQERKNLQSTKIIQPSPLTNKEEIDMLNDHFPINENLHSPTNECMAIIMPFTSKDTGYADLTGRFPFVSSRGNQYLLIVYDYDSNAILAEPIKSRRAKDITTAFQKIHKKLSKRGAAPKFYILDNEISGEFKSALDKNELKYQLAPPHQHRRNAAERAIQTFKNHFLAGLSSTDPNYPISEWDRLIEQAVITLNLLRNARLNPKLSSYAFLFGNYDFNSWPMAPPGTKILIHEKPKQRSTWAPHGLEGWYIGPSIEHYRCIKAFIPSTFQERITDTVEFFPYNVPMPATSDADYLKQAADDILSILAKPSPTLPFLQHSPSLKSAIAQTAVVLHRAVSKPPSLQNTIDNIHLTSKPVTSPRVSKTIDKTVVQRNTHLPPTIPKALHSTTSFAPPSGTNFKKFQLQYLFATEFFTPKVNHIYNKITGKRETADTLLKGPDKDIWDRAVSNEIGRLARGNKYGVTFTETIEFIALHEVPENAAVTYASMIFDHRPLKEEEYRCRIVAGGDKLDFLDDASSPATSLLETKILVNSIISDAKHGAKFMSADLKDFFLASPMLKPEYMKMALKHIPDDIIQQYNLLKIAVNGYVYIKIVKGMYGLKQAAILAYQQLVQYLKPAGYSQIPGTSGMWHHKTRKTIFCLCVDDFGVKYHNKNDIDHLIQTLEQHYKVSKDWAGHNYCGLTFSWHYEEGFVDVSMPGYIDKVLARYQHPKPIKPEYQPHKHAQPIYSSKPQMAPIDTSPLLDSKTTKRIQGIVGSLLYYARAIDNTMLTAITEISAVQSKPTQQTLDAVTKLLDYAATYPDTTIRFHASDMVLYGESDAAYLVLPNARSRVSGYFYLSHNVSPSSTTIPQTKRNGPLLIVCKSLRHVVASAAEAETGALFHNAREAIPIRQTLIAMGHPQPPTPLKTDNTTALSFIKSNIRQKKSKSWDMRYNWLRDRTLQQQFQFYWDKGVHNDADYHSKHHAAKHHLEQRHKFVLIDKPVCQLLFSYFSHAKPSGKGVLIPRGIPYNSYPFADVSDPIGRHEFSSSSSQLI